MDVNSKDSEWDTEDDSVPSNAKWVTVKRAKRQKKIINFKEIHSKGISCEANGWYQDNKNVEKDHPNKPRTQGGAPVKCDESEILESSGDRDKENNSEDEGSFIIQMKIVRGLKCLYDNNIKISPTTTLSQIRQQIAGKHAIASKDMRFAKGINSCLFNILPASSLIPNEAVPLINLGSTRNLILYCGFKEGTNSDNSLIDIASIVRQANLYF